MKTKKEIYDLAEMEVIRFSVEDIITTSDPDFEEGGGDDEEDFE